MLDNVHPLTKQERWHQQKATAALAVLLSAALMPSGVQGQSRQSTRVPDHFEYFEGHGYMGGEWVKWEHDRLVFTKRIADMKGKGSFDETKERLEPAPQAWSDFGPASTRWVSGNGNQITTTRSAIWPDGNHGV
jgi:hypothetical protein